MTYMHLSVLLTWRTHHIHTGEQDCLLSRLYFHEFYHTLEQPSTPDTQGEVKAGRSEVQSQLQDITSSKVFWAT